MFFRPTCLKKGMWVVGQFPNETDPLPFQRLAIRCSGLRPSGRRSLADRGSWQACPDPARWNCEAEGFIAAAMDHMTGSGTLSAKLIHYWTMHPAA
jgi:hypothetical protein